MADDNQCRAVRLFGGDWDYQCRDNLPAVVLKRAAAETPKSKEPEQQSCRTVRSGGDYFEICTPKGSSTPPASGASSTAPAPSLWNTLESWVIKLLSSPPQQRAMYRR